MTIIYVTAYVSCTRGVVRLPRMFLVWVHIWTTYSRVWHIGYFPLLLYCCCVLKWRKASASNLVSSLFCVLWRKLHLSLLPLSLILYMVSELGSWWGAQAASRGKRRSWNPGKRISISLLVSFWEHTGAGTQSWMQSVKPQIEAPFVVEHESITWKNLTP